MFNLNCIFTFIILISGINFTFPHVVHMYFYDIFLRIIHKSNIAGNINNQVNIFIYFHKIIKVNKNLFPFL